MPDYSQGKIYKLWCPSNDLVYIGSTTQPLYKRLNQHKSKKEKTNSHLLYDTGHEVKIELVEEFSCNSKMELDRKEGEWIRKTECVNKVIAGRTNIEYRRDNAEKIKQYNAKTSERKKEWYEDNKERMQTLAKAKYKRTKEVVKARAKARYEDKKEEIHAKQRQYNEKNKDKVAEYMKKYYEKNKDKLNEVHICMCGCEVKRRNTASHLKTEKHKQLMEAQN